MPTNLFAAPTGRTDNIQFRAGRLTLEGGIVKADPRKGLFHLVDEGGALVLRWTDRATNVVDDVAHLYPGQATFTRVEKCTTGRVYVLNFLDCERQEFFWMQEPKEDKDKEYVEAIRKRLRGDSSGDISGRTRGAARGGRGSVRSGTSQNELQMLQQLLLHGAGTGNNPDTQMHQQLLDLLSAGNTNSTSVSSSVAPSPSPAAISNASLDVSSASVQPQLARRAEVSLTQIISSVDVSEAIQTNPHGYLEAVASTLPCTPASDGSDLMRHLRNPQLQYAASMLQDALRDRDGFHEVCAAFHITPTPRSVPSVRAFLEAIIQEESTRRSQAVSNGAQQGNNENKGPAETD